MRTICMDCKRVIRDTPDPPHDISHGLCDECAERRELELQDPVMSCVDCGDKTANRCAACNQPTCVNCLTDPALGLCDLCYQKDWDSVVDSQVYRVAMRAGGILAWEYDRARHIWKLEHEVLLATIYLQRKALDRNLEELVNQLADRASQDMQGLVALLTMKPGGDA